jgi:hypothetical protein
MTIQDLGALGDLLSSLAVFVSLIYLAVQVRHNAEATRSLFRNFENMYYQHRAGHLDDDLWVGWKTMMVSYGHRPGFQQWWRFRRPVFSQDFVDFIDNTEIEPIASYFDLTRQRS